MKRTQLEKNLYEIAYQERKEYRIKKQMIRELKGTEGLIAPQELAEFRISEDVSDVEKEGFLLRSLWEELEHLISYLEEIEDQDRFPHNQTQVLMEQKLLFFDLLYYLQDK